MLRKKSCETCAYLELHKETIDDGFKVIGYGCYLDKSPYHIIDKKTYSNGCENWVKRVPPIKESRFMNKINMNFKKHESRKEHRK